jgi:hypothetical protein
MIGYFEEWLIISNAWFCFDRVCFKGGNVMGIRQIEFYLDQN